MNLSRASKTGVKGPDGLFIQLDRGKIRYSVRGKHLHVLIDHGVGEVSIFSDSIKQWFPPFSQEEIKNTEKREILDNICHAMNMLNIGYEIE